MSAKRMENASTLTLLRKMMENIASWFIAFDEYVFALMVWIVSVCFWKRTSTVALGRATYHSVLDITTPMKRYIKKEIALLCSCKRVRSWSMIMSLLSSSFMVLYMMGRAAITMKSTITMLACSRNIHSARSMA